MLYHGIWDDMWELPEKDSFAKSVSRQNGMYQMLSWDNQCHPNSCNSYLREKSMERISEKSSIYAYFFSIILPGLGQIYLDHKKRGFTILTGALILSLALSFLFAFPLNWIIMATYWIWQVFDAFFLYRSVNKGTKTFSDKQSSEFNNL